MEGDISGNLGGREGGKGDQEQGLHLSFSRLLVLFPNPNNQVFILSLHTVAYHQLLFPVS